MKTIKVDLSSDIEKLELHSFSDDHTGDAHCDKKLIQERIAHIEHTPNAFAGLHGDLMNNATTQSVSDTYTEKLSPMQQIEQVATLYWPIRHKLLYVVPGNHEFRSYKSEGIDISAIIAKELGVYDRYSDTAAFVFLRFGCLSRRKSENRKATYGIYVTHGTGGGKKIGGKANRLEDLAGIVDADLYLHGHTHAPMAFKQEYFRVNYSNSSVEQVQKVFVNTAAALNYGGYGSSQGFKPSSKDNPVILLDGTKKDIKVTV